LPGCIGCRDCSGTIRAGEIFTRDCVREIRGLGYLALANAIVQIVVRSPHWC
jgi:hypothetical protein